MRLRLLCLLLLVFPFATHAAIVQQQMRPGIPATAEYTVGERSKPAVLLIHGFLQTRDFPTVATLATGLQEAGYSVLTPTLSLNIPNRSTSLACEALHRHSMEDDIEEIARWVAWLKTRGHSNIVLLGHSFGSMQALAYLLSKPDPAVQGFIGASLVEAQIGDVSRARLIADLENRVLTKQRAPVTHLLSFCRKYTSPPDTLLSYVRWDQARVLGALKRVPVNAQLIIGGADTMLGQGWIKALRHIKVPMVVVHGANHFMDGQHEFDLLDHTLHFLARSRTVAAQ